MQIPPAEIIESAYDELKAMAAAQDAHLADQWREFRAAIGAQSADFENGYALGLETARVMLRQSTALILAKVDASEVL